MKFWQLMSIAREQRELVSKLAAEQPNWQRYASYAENFATIVNAQNRQILDEPIDPQFSEAVLSQVKRRLYLGDGWLRSQRLHSEKEISASEAAKRFGGEAVENALEYGSISVTGA